MYHYLRLWFCLGAIAVGGFFVFQTPEEVEGAITKKDLLVDIFKIEPAVAIAAMNDAITTSMHVTNKPALRLEIVNAVFDAAVATKNRAIQKVGRTEDGFDTLLMYYGLPSDATLGELKLKLHPPTPTPIP